LKRRGRRAELAAAAFAAAALHADSRGGCSHGSGNGGSSGQSNGGEATDDCGCEGIVTSPALLRLIRDTTRESLRLQTPWADQGAARLSWQLLGALLRQADGGGLSESAAFAAAVREWLLPRLREPLFAPHRHSQAQDRGCAGGPGRASLGGNLQLGAASSRPTPPPCMRANPPARRFVSPSNAFCGPLSPLSTHPDCLRALQGPGPVPARPRRPPAGMGIAAARAARAGRRPRRGSAANGAGRLG
jgi:hypothetical protein